MPRRLRSTMVAFGVAALLIAGCGSEEDGASGTTDVGDGTIVMTAQGELGTFLTDATGATLYLFTDDAPGVSTCTDACLAAWPAVLTDGAPVAGTGVDAALLGTLARDDGGVQVTYAGWPLYRYAGDGAPGDTSGQGVGGVWFLVSPDGATIGDGPDAGSGPGMGGSLY